MSNLDLYNAVRHVPENAKKEIGGGRIKGFTDINPMWRIKTLTEQFGVCGVGWYFEVLNQWLEQGADGQVMAFCTINLYIKYENNWSRPIVGVGGAMAVTKEVKGYYTDDECYKKALTDAISVACKHLGMGADVYWEKDTSKYSTRQQLSKQENSADEAVLPPVKCDKCGKTMLKIKKSDGRTIEPEDAKKLMGGLCLECFKEQQNGGTD